MAKIGVGIITCNRLDYFKQLYASLPLDKIDEIVVINDGAPVEIKIEKGVWLDNPSNIGVGKSKNKALKHLMDKGCDYLFLIEDDMIILDSSVFDKYIQAHLKSGIHHFNYGPGSPFNRKQKIEFDLHNRHLLDQHSDPNPKMIIEYDRETKVALYEHTVAMFSFYTRETIEKVGYIDEEFDQCWEHVLHTHNIAKAGYHPPCWWFADIADSDKYLTEAPGAIANSAIAKDKSAWMEKVMKGREIYKQKVGYYPNHCPLASKKEVIDILRKIKNEKHSS